MSSDNPPYPYYPSIPFNPGFFSTDTGTGNGLTEAQANTKYLRKTTPDTATAVESFNAGIKTDTISSVSASTMLITPTNAGATLRLGTNTPTTNVDIATQNSRSVVLHLGDGNSNTSAGGVHINNGTSCAGSVQILNGITTSGSCNILTGQTATGDFNVLTNTLGNTSTGNINLGNKSSTVTIAGNTNINKTASSGTTYIGNGQNDTTINGLNTKIDGILMLGTDTTADVTVGNSSNKTTMGSNTINILTTISNTGTVTVGVPTTTIALNGSTTAKLTTTSTGVTQVIDDDSTKLATTGYVKQYGYGRLNVTNQQWYNPQTFNGDVKSTKIWSISGQNANELWGPTYGNSGSTIDIGNASTINLNGTTTASLSTTSTAPTQLTTVSNTTLATTAFVNSLSFAKKTVANAFDLLQTFTLGIATNKIDGLLPDSAQTIGSNITTGSIAIGGGLTTTHMTLHKNSGTGKVKVYGGGLEVSKIISHNTEELIIQNTASTVTIGTGGTVALNGVVKINIGNDSTTTIGQNSGSNTTNLNSVNTIVSGTLQANTIEPTTVESTVSIADTQTDGVLSIGNQNGSRTGEIRIGKYTKGDIIIADGSTVGTNNYIIVGTDAVSKMYLRGSVVNIQDQATSGNIILGTSVNSATITVNKPLTIGYSAPTLNTQLGYTITNILATNLNLAINNAGGSQTILSSSLVAGTWICCYQIRYSGATTTVTSLQTNMFIVNSSGGNKNGWTISNVTQVIGGATVVSSSAVITTTSTQSLVLVDESVYSGTTALQVGLTGAVQTYLIATRIA